MNFQFVVHHRKSPPELGLIPFYELSDGRSSESQTGGEIITNKDESGTKVIIKKPEDMSEAKWEKIVIQLTRNFEPLGVKIRSVNI